MSIHQHPLLWGMEFVTKWRLHNSCLALHLCIFFQTSLWNEGCPCLCQSNLFWQAQRDVWYYRAFSPQWERKLDGVFFFFSVRVIHACQTDRVTLSRTEIMADLQRVTLGEDVPVNAVRNDTWKTPISHRVKLSVTHLIAIRDMYSLLYLPSRSRRNNTNNKHDWSQWIIKTVQMKPLMVSVVCWLSLIHPDTADCGLKPLLVSSLYLLFSPPSHTWHFSLCLRLLDAFPLF